MENARSRFARNFHVAGMFLIIIGIAGSAVSLLWDVIYRGRPFSLQSIGPLKVAGMVAGLIIVNLGIAAGFALGIRKRPVPVKGPGPALSENHPGLLIPGVILTIFGLGGTLLSLFWDVVSKRKPFDPDAIGPFKLAGMLAGMSLLAAGLLLFFLGRSKVRARKSRIVGPLQGPGAEREEIPFALPVGQARAPASGTQPMEAIPVETWPDGRRDERA